MAISDVRGAGPFLAWPGMANLRVSLPLAFSFLKLFTSVYGGASLLAGLHAAHAMAYFDFELRLPFVPSLVIVYLTVPVALALAPFILRTWREITPLFLTLTVETLVGGLCFLLFPLEQGYPPRVAAAGFWGGLFHLADVLNLEYNEVPSLHVTFAVTAALVFGRRCGRLGRTLFALWAVAVAVSALLMHEHHLLDVAAGAVLAFATVGSVQRWASRDSFLDALQVELLCLREFACFVRRHRRYLLTFAALYRASFPNWRKTRVLRAAYCLAQHVDDVLDGDRQVPGDPEAYVQEILRGLRGEAPFGDSAADRLAEFLLPELPAEARGDLIALFEVLLEDRRRMAARRTWSAAALAEHHRKTFHYSLNLTLTLAGAALRASDAPELIAALSWCSPVRDLEEDRAKGLINIPGAVLERGAVEEWLREEHERGAAAIAALGRRLPTIDDPRSRSILTAFHRALAIYERKYRQGTPG